MRATPILLLSCGLASPLWAADLPPEPLPGCDAALEFAVDESCAWQLDGSEIADRFSDPEGAALSCEAIPSEGSSLAALLGHGRCADPAGQLSEGCDMMFYPRDLSPPTLAPALAEVEINLDALGGQTFYSTVETLCGFTVADNCTPAGAVLRGIDDIVSSDPGEAITGALGALQSPYMASTWHEIWIGADGPARSYDITYAALDAYGNRSESTCCVSLTRCEVGGCLPDQVTLLEFDESTGAAITPYGDWSEVLRHPDWVETVTGPAGLATRVETPDMLTAYFGIRGTTPIFFEKGQQIVATFHNRSAFTQKLRVRVSLEDPDNPSTTEPWPDGDSCRATGREWLPQCCIDDTCLNSIPTQWECENFDPQNDWEWRTPLCQGASSDAPWMTMYTEGENHESEVPSGAEGQIVFNIVDAAGEVHAPLAQPSAGHHHLINLSFHEPDSYHGVFVLRRIELRRSADVQPPPAPVLDPVEIVSVSENAGQTLLRLSWDPVADAEGPLDHYRVYRDGVLHETIPQRDLVLRDGKVVFEDLSVRAGHRYAYEVAAVDSAIFGFQATVEQPDIVKGNESLRAATGDVDIPALDAPSLVDPMADLHYLGAFRLPTVTEGHTGFAYAWQGLAAYPDGNVAPLSSELSGSLYVLGRSDPLRRRHAETGFTRYNDQIAEITIPAPALAETPDALPRARMIQGFTDDIWPDAFTWFDPDVCQCAPGPRDDPSTWRREDHCPPDYFESCDWIVANDLWNLEMPQGGGDPWAGIGYHPEVVEGTGLGEAIYASVFNSYAGEDPKAHGAFSLDLTQSVGHWFIGGPPGSPAHIAPKFTDKFIFAAPRDWADTHLGGRSLIIGQGYQSGVGVESHGPSLYAIAPWDEPGGAAFAGLPRDEDDVPATELLRYGGDSAPETWNTGWDLSQGYGGAAFLEIPEEQSARRAVVIAISDPRGDSWYGSSDGGESHLYDGDLPAAFSSSQHRGPHTTRRMPALMFYDPAQLAAVANETLASHAPKPYALLDLDDILLYAAGRQEVIVGAISFDPRSGMLYMIEGNGDFSAGTEAHQRVSMVHAWRVGP